MKLAALLRESIERRSGEDRRVENDSDYFRNGGVEKRRRRRNDRRIQGERRFGWTRISNWSSAKMHDLNFVKYLLNLKSR